MKTPIIEAIKYFLKEKKFSFHMPGHKAGSRGTAAIEDVLTKHGLAVDLTEVPGLDDLHHPSGAILEAEELAANLFEAEKTFLLTNGATSGILASLLSCTEPGDEIIVPRNIHRSIFSAMVLADLNPIYIQPPVLDSWQLPLQASYKDYCTALKERKPKALVVVNPTYEGVAGNLEKIIKASNGKQVYSIVDEAHGTLFPFDCQLPASGLTAGGDFVVHGAHKTFGSLTQTGFLHLGNVDVNTERVRQALSLVNSTSPSYILLASLDGARAEFSLEGQEKLRILIENCKKIIDIISSLRGISCLNQEIVTEADEFKAIDATKIAVSAQKLGLTGHQLSAILRQQYKIEVELAQDYYVLLVVGIGTAANELDHLIRALTEIDFKYWEGGRSYDLLTSHTQLPPIPTQVISPRDSYYKKTKSVKLEEAVGEICGQLICPYPPGIPIACPGEELTIEVVSYLKELLSRGKHVQGISGAGAAHQTIKVVANY